MSKMRIGIAILTFLLCAAVSGCNKNKEPDPAKLQTPQYSVEQAPELSISKGAEVHHAEDGIKVIAPDSASASEASENQSEPALPASQTGITPDTVWSEDRTVTFNAFTLPEQAAFDNGSIGYLTIPKINLSVNVYESADAMEDMYKGAAHFKSTSAWDGNIGLSAHNVSVKGSGAYFQNLYQLAAGDSIIYKTALGEREYVVTTVKTIGDEDWSYITRSADNRLTLITCVNNNGAKRLLVQAIQK